MAWSEEYMKDNWRQMLKEKHLQLLAIIDMDSGLRGELLRRKFNMIFITRLYEGCTKRKKIETLLEHVQQGDFARFSDFCSALRDSVQGPVVDLIYKKCCNSARESGGTVTDGVVESPPELCNYSLSSQKSYNIRRSWNEIIMGIEWKSGLFDFLQKSKYGFTMDQLQGLLDETDSFKRNESLLQMLLQGSEQRFQDLCCALDNSNQHHIATLMKKGPFHRQTSEVTVSASPMVPASHLHTSSSCPETSTSPSSENHVDQSSPSDPSVTVNMPNSGAITDKPVHFTVPCPGVTGDQMGVSDEVVGKTLQGKPVSQPAGDDCSSGDLGSYSGQVTSEIVPAASYVTQETNHSPGPSEFVNARQRSAEPLSDVSCVTAGIETVNISQTRPSSAASFYQGPVTGANVGEVNFAHRTVGVQHSVLVTGSVVEGGLAHGNNRIAQPRAMPPACAYRVIDESDKQIIDIRFGIPSPDFIDSILSQPQIYCVVGVQYRGRAIIFNNEIFHIQTEQPNREGSTVDEQNLKNLFIGLGFDVKIYKDKTAKEMIDIMMTESTGRDYDTKQPHQQHLDKSQIFVLCILSHGSDGGKIYGTDGHGLLTKDIQKIYDGHNCKLLGGIPKLFIIQACGGGLVTQGCVPGSTETDSIVDHSCSPTIADCEKDPRKIHERSDIVLANSTVGDYVAYRNKKYGSWFIRSIVKVFMERAHKDDLMSMLTEVNKRVTEMRTDISSECPYQHIQAPETSSTLRDKLYLLPICA